MRKTIVIGGGASGLIAACVSAEKGNKVTLIEKNEKLGKKIYITGKGRCNLTNDVLFLDFFNNVVSNPKFLYSSISSFSPQETMVFFEKNGLTLKTERGNRVFPASDKASDVTKTLEKVLKKNNVNILLETTVVDILTEKGEMTGVKLENGEVLFADSVIVCCGGLSYPLTGSTGEGYDFARKFGHSIVEPKPGLVGIELKGNDFGEMQGLSLKNVSISAVVGQKKLYSDFGEMLFTHFGVSGPIILSCSSVINRRDLNNVDLIIDLKPALSETILEERLLREFKENNLKEITSVMRSLLPKTIISCVLRQAMIKPAKKCCEITVIERQNLITSLKGLRFKMKKLRPIEEAIITAGGVNVKEINPKTMESKLQKGLFFAGEVIDVDAFTGGFNLQIAFSTGFVAGKNS